MTMTAPRAHENGSRRPRQRGFTLTEIAIVLGIMGLILGAIWVAASSVYTNMRVSTTTRNVISLSQGIRNLYANQGSITDNPTTATLVSTGVIPNDMVVPAAGANGPSLIDNWGGTVTFSVTAISNPGDSFVIDLAGIPQAGCVGLLTDSSTKSTGSGIYGLNAQGGGTGTAAVYTTAAGVGSTTSYTATTSVNACSTTINNNVGYAFSIH